MREERENFIGLNHTDYLKLKKLIRRFPSLHKAVANLNVMTIDGWHVFTEIGWATLVDAIAVNPKAKQVAESMNMDVTPLVADIIYEDPA
jgi:nitric oxide synthase oxygenase domain/subunit